MDPRVFILVLNWNRPVETARCVRSLQELNYDNFQIVLVDNGSDDDSVQELSCAFSSIPLLANRKNLGYAAGNNVGIRYALNHGADYILLLNNDTVVDPMFLPNLMDVARSDPAIGILGPKICDFAQRQKIWFAGSHIDWESGDSPHWGIGQEDAGQFNQVLDVQRLCGCAMIVQRDVFERIGFLDERYFLYFEDVDFCVRAARAGFRNVCVQTATVWHEESSTTKANVGSDLHTYYHVRNRLLFLKTHREIPKAMGQKNRKLCRDYLKHVLRRPFDEKFRKAYSAEFDAIMDFYLRRFGAKAKYQPRCVGN